MGENKINKTIQWINFIVSIIGFVGKITIEIVQAIPKKGE